MAVPPRLPVALLPTAVPHTVLPPVQAGFKKSAGAKLSQVATALSPSFVAVLWAAAVPTPAPPIRPTKAIADNSGVDFFLRPLASSEATTHLPVAAFQTMR